MRKTRTNWRGRLGVVRSRRAYTLRKIRRPDESYGVSYIHKLITIDLFTDLLSYTLAHEGDEWNVTFTLRGLPGVSRLELWGVGSLSSLQVSSKIVECTKGEIEGSLEYLSHTYKSPLLEVEGRIKGLGDWRAVFSWKYFGTVYYLTPGLFPIPQPLWSRNNVRKKFLSSESRWLES